MPMESLLCIKFDVDGGVRQEGSADEHRSGEVIASTSGNL